MENFEINEETLSYLFMIKLEESIEKLIKLCGIDIDQSKTTLKELCLIVYRENNIPKEIAILPYVLYRFQFSSLGYNINELTLSDFLPIYRKAMEKWLKENNILEMLNE